MNYQEIKPSPLLASYINCFWILQGAPNTCLQDRSFPDGCLEIIFNVNTRVLRSNQDGKLIINSAAELVGQLTTFYSVQTEGENKFLGVRFFPHTLACFVKENIQHFNDQTVDLTDVFGSDFRVVTEQVVVEPDWLKSIALLEQFLLLKIRAVADRRKFLLVDYAVKHILLHKEKSNLDHLTRDCGITYRYLQQVFAQLVGLSPRLLISIIRFQKTFQYLNHRQHSLTSIAYECGYFDQSHFIRDFKKFSGVTPAAYKPKYHPLNKFFLTEENASYLYNY